MTQPATYPDVIRVRVTPALDAQLREAAQRAGAPVSELIRQSLDWYLSHPSVKAQTKEV